MKGEMGRGEQDREGLTWMLCQSLDQAKGLSGQGSLSQSNPVTTPNPCCSSLSDSSANPSSKWCVNDTVPNMRLLWASSRTGRAEQHLLRSYCSVSSLCFAGGKEREPTSELPILTRKNYIRQSETEQPLPSKKSFMEFIKLYSAHG